MLAVRHDRLAGVKKYDNIRNPFRHETLPGESEGNGPDDRCEPEYDKPLAKRSGIYSME